MEIEEQADICPLCNNLVISYWVVGGGCIRSPFYELIADWIVHATCWDKIEIPDGIRDEEVGSEVDGTF